MSMYIPASLAGGRYTVGNLVGHGGMAEVHVGTDTRLGRTVAIKIMRADLASDPIFIERFRREAHSVASLNNPNIVSIYDSGEEDIKDDAGRDVSVPYLVMEYVQGQTLRDILKANGALSQRDAEQVMLGVLGALEYSHRMGIIHRDIKPGNIMISDQGVVKVMDFGIARALDDSSATMTQSQGVVGTAQYLSPEQARGENVDMRSDLYSAGCVLYEMLTGRPPFTGDSAVAIAFQHVSEVATPPSAIVPGLPKLWDSICAKAMAKDRQNRYTTATEFRGDILALMNGGTPVAAAFNPLTDLANAKGRKDIGATQVLTPPTATPGGNGNGGGETVAFNPLNDQPQTPPTPGPGSRSDQRAAAAKAKRRKKAIIGTIIGLLVVAAVAAGAWFMLKGGQADMGTVPTISEAMSKELACEKVKDAGFTCQTKDDDNSSKEKGTFTKQSPAGGEKAEKGTAVTLWYSTGPGQVAVPDLKGDTQEEAKTQLEKLGFTVSSTATTEDSADVEKDHVTRTNPASGTTQPKGTTIMIYISSGMTSVPEGLVGTDESAATKKLEDAGLSATVQQENSSSVPSGSVTRTDPGEGMKVDQGSTVTLYVSSGAEKTSVPNVVGKTLAEAKAALGDFSVKVSGSSDDNAKVTAQSPSNGQVDKGSTITLTTQASSSSSPSPSSSNSSSSSSDSSNSSSDDQYGIVGKTQAEAKQILNSNSVTYTISGTGDDNAKVKSVTKNGNTLVVTVE
ncbi:Stk1 family PASTA domain-containing Ser/Thr kinase [Bifidobacterium simiarum]|uniref:Stk1 family PASTA domain-containing Ser/Thr kinase n=1 Tax=Bifidobacterium simiarum TaxID=2045441 RepID=UPI001BDD4972|nr:Stk1 family PASTA domain-containing Ser/Thr kinase [Bifidobacterium simiarum]MBT1166915.1 Stk1 family PASTA domain-containing Ser/Thr kinase [Bifidobacterium simiarum]